MWIPQTAVALLALILAVAAFVRTHHLVARADVTDGVMRWHALFDQRNLPSASARLRAQGSYLKSSNNWQFSTPATAEQAQSDFGAVVSMLDAAIPVVALAQRHKSTWEDLGPHMLGRLQNLATAVAELRWEASKCQSTWDALTVYDQLERDFKETITTLNLYHAVSDHTDGGAGLDYEHPDPYESNRKSRAARPPC
ncbi:hypothetical protein [Demequina aurantiaca]|uniref:hypothetical protein n=1 Tax=Demequina aurantiaca TaxID=676200 RepID=UPI003D33386E